MKIKITIALLIALAGGIALSAEYVGSGTCRNCHEPEYKKWIKSPHAGSAQKLSDEDKANIKCQKCHFTGGDKQKFHEVGCEACHGPGQYYIQLPVMKDKELAAAVGLIAKPDLALCKSCHNPETSSKIKRIKFEKALEDICVAKPKAETEETAQP